MDVFPFTFIYCYYQSIFKKLNYAVWVIILQNCYVDSGSISQLTW